MGVFRARPDEPHFADSGPARAHLVVFPVTAVRITHAGSAPIVATPARVMFYNRGAEYRREAIAAEGDLCTWLAFDAADLSAAFSPSELAGAHDLLGDGVAARDDRPFSRTTAPVTPRTVLRQRLLLRSVLAGDDDESVEERMFSVLATVVDDASGGLALAGRAPPARMTAGCRARRDLATAAEGLLAARFTERLSLDALSRALGASPFHLCRVFRGATGRTLHGYVTELRLHRALERILDGEPSLAALAVDLGFATHSHFTRAFRRRFGVSPSSVRAMPSAAAAYESMQTSLSTWPRTWSRSRGSR